MSVDWSKTLATLVMKLCHFWKVGHRKRHTIILAMVVKLNTTQSVCMVLMISFIPYCTFCGPRKFGSQRISSYNPISVIFVIVIKQSMAGFFFFWFFFFFFYLV